MQLQRFVQATGSVEPALSGAVAGTAAGKFSKAPVKGNAGVYVFQVVKKSMRAGSKYDETLVMQQLLRQICSWLVTLCRI